MKAIKIFSALALCAAASFAEDETVGTWWHWMNGHITRDGITKDLEAMKAAGIGNATIFNAHRPFASQFKMAQTAKENVREIDESTMPTVKFASPEWFELFRFALDEAARLGIEIGAANCDGWSESGGPWITPELSMKELVWTKEPVCGLQFAVCSGGCADPSSAQKDAPQQPQTANCKLQTLPQLQTANCKLQTSSLPPQPTGRNGYYVDIAVVTNGANVYRFGYTTNGKKNHPASPEGSGLECDKMDAAALDWHFAHYPQWLIEAAGPHAGKTFRYFLVDSWECGSQTWTAKFPEEFAARRGYDPIPWLPVLAGDVVGSPEDSEAFLHDFRLTCSDLIIDNYFKRLAKLCHEHGMLLYSEGIYGWDNLPAVDVLRTYKYCDVPMTEFWAKVAAHYWPFKMSYVEPLKHFSPQHAATLYNKPIVASEAYTGYCLYSDSPFDLKPYGDRAFAGGLNKMILHSYVHQPTDAAPGLTLGIYGQAFNRLNPWYNFSRSFWEYHERIQDAMQGGVFVADALVYIGDKLPAFEMKDDEIARLLPPGRTFQYINQDVLLSGRVTARDGMIWLDDDKCYTEILIRHDALDLATMQKLAELHDAGAAVAGVKPVRTLRLMNRAAETAALREISDRIWGERTFMHPPSDANDVGFVSDGDAATIWSRHVRKGKKDIYFLASAFDFAERRLRLFFNNRISMANEAVLLDPETGLRYRLGDTFGVFNLRLRPRQSVLVVFGEDTAGLPDYATKVLNPEITGTKTLERVDGTITFESEPGIAPMPIGRFHSLTEEKDPDVKYYCGVLRYDFTVSSEVLKNGGSPGGRVLMYMPQFGSTAEVTVNGRLVGTMWDPYAPLDITEAVRGDGDAHFSIRVTNPWRNRLIGDLISPRGDKNAFTTSPGIDKYDTKAHISKSAELIPTGISQPLKFEFTL